MFFYSSECLRIDNNKEYIGQFGTYCKTHGIRYENTCEIH